MCHPYAKIRGGLRTSIAHLFNYVCGMCIDTYIYIAVDFIRVNFICDRCLYVDTATSRLALRNKGPLSLRATVTFLLFAGGLR